MHQLRERCVRENSESKDNLPGLSHVVLRNCKASRPTAEFIKEARDNIVKALNWMEEAGAVDVVRSQ